MNNGENFQLNPGLGSDLSLGSLLIISAPSLQSAVMVPLCITNAGLISKLFISVGMFLGVFRNASTGARSTNSLVGRTIEIISKKRMPVLTMCLEDMAAMGIDSRPYKFKVDGITAGFTKAQMINRSDLNARRKRVNQPRKHQSVKTDFWATPTCASIAVLVHRPIPDPTRDSAKVNTISDVYLREKAREFFGGQVINGKIFSSHIRSVLSMLVRAAWGVDSTPAARLILA